MRGKNSEIFRKSSLERISSPESLNEYIRVVNPGLILILAAIFLIVLACGFWFFSGRIPKYLDLTGVSVTTRSGDQKVYCYVPISTAKRLTTDMEVQISPDYAPKEQYGYINGRVLSVSSDVITEEYLEYNFENPRIVLPALSDLSLNLIQVELSMDGWSNSKGEVIDVVDGSMCTVSVIESEQKPYELIFNA